MTRTRKRGTAAPRSLRRAPDVDERNVVYSALVGCTDEVCHDLLVALPK